MSGSCGATSVVAIAGEIHALVGQLDELTSTLAVLLRDGPTDARPVQSAKDLLDVSGTLAHVASVVSILGFAQGTVTGVAADDAMSSMPGWCQRHLGVTRTETTTMTRAARCLARYPRIATAFLDGRIRVGHLVSVDRIIPPHFTGSALEHAIEQVGSVEI